MFRMEKSFRILEITPMCGNYALAQVADVDNENDVRILCLNPLRKNEASGIELTDNYKVTHGMGYCLCGEKPLNEWSVNDIVHERFYPAKLDNRPAK